MRLRTVLWGVPVTIVDAALALILVFLLGGCAPTVTAALNATAGGPADLLFVVDDSTPCGPQEVNGLCFAPNGVEAQGVIVAARSRTGDLAAFAEVCRLVDEGVRCDLGTLTEPTFVYLAGPAVQASATYRNPGSNRIYSAFASF